jgi:hypothetical protein
MRTRDKVSAALLLLTLLSAMLAIGGVMRWSQALVGVVAAISIVPLLWARSGAERVSPLLVLLGLAAAFTAIQIIPLPSSVVEFLHGSGEGIRQDGATLAGTSPASTLSLDPPATLRAFGFFVILFGVAIVALRLSVQERGRYYVVGGVAISIGVTALVTLVHELVGATALYGLYTPRATPAILGPLLNENHLGGLMALGAVSAVGLVLYERQPTKTRGLWLMIAIICSATAVLTQSRGASIALAAGLVVTIGILGARRLGGGAHQRRRHRLLTSAVPAGVVAVSTIVIAIYASAGGLQRQLDKTSLQDMEAPQSKFAAWRSAMKLVEDSPWVGVGRGAMESSFSRVHPASAQVTFSHVENEYLQTVVDFGVPAAIVLAGALIWVAIMAMRRWRGGALSAAALGGIACIAVQSNVDFGIEFLGLAIPVVALLATVTYTPLREIPRASVLRSRGLRVGLITLMLVGVVTMFLDATRSIDQDREQIESAEQTITVAELSEIIARHPLHYYPFAVTAQRLARERDQRAIRFLNHALLLHPTHPGLHHMAARMLRSAGYRDQAVIEYAAALRGTTNKPRMLREIVSVFDDDAASRTLPNTVQDLEVVVKILRDLERPQVATLWLTRLLATQRSARACEALFEISLQGRDLNAATAAGKNCHDAMPDRHTRFSLARLLYSNKRYAEILPLLRDVEDWKGRIDDTVSAWLLTCDAQIGLGNLDEAKRCLRRLDVSGDVRIERRGELTSRFEQIEKLRAQPNSAPINPSTNPSIKL